MNDFEYAIAVANIPNIKTLKAKDAEIRRIIGNLYTYGRLSHADILPKCNTYKYLIQVCSSYKNFNKMPAIVSTKIHFMHRHLLEELVAHTFDYRVIVDTFQFDNVIHLNDHDINFIRKLSIIVGSSPIKIPFRYRLRAGNLATSIAALTSNQTDALAKCITVELLKVSMDSSIKYTVIEDCLAFYRMRVMMLDTEERTKLNILSSEVVMAIDYTLENL